MDPPNFDFGAVRVVLPGLARPRRHHAGVAIQDERRPTANTRPPRYHIGPVGILQPWPPARMSLNVRHIGGKKDVDLPVDSAREVIREVLLPGSFTAGRRVRLGRNANHLLRERDQITGQFIDGSNDPPLRCFIQHSKPHACLQT